MVLEIILSVALGLVVMLLIASAKQVIVNDGELMYETRTVYGDSKKKFTLGGVGDIWVWAVCGGVIVGTINFFAPKVITSAPWLAPIFLVVMVAGFVGLAAWWKKEGGRLSEMVPFIVLAILFFFTAASAASATMGLVPAGIWRSIIGLIPCWALVATLGYFFIDYLYFLYGEIDKDGSEESRLHLLLARVAVAATVILLAIFTVVGIAWAKADASGGTGANQTNEWYKFYNSDVQKDGDDSNNFNFGPNPYADGKTATDYDADFRERLKWDPALAAASTAWLDANVGTRYLGEFYESCKGDWAKTMNEAKIRFMNDQQAYYHNLDSYFAFLDSAVKVEVRDCKSVTDQMYMNPYTPDGVPDVIVLATDDHSGHELVYTFMIKGDTFEVAYRIECGYQPTNVEEVMGITPQNKETITPTPTPESTPIPTPESTPIPTPEPTPIPTPEPEPTPIPTPDNPKKDPSKLTDADTESNDNKGPGESTNNPSDPQHSTADKPTNSTTYPSYDAYRQDMDKLEETNATQQTGKDSNEPTTPTPSNTTVDNNGDKGTGNGDINKPTETSKPATEADTGKPIDSTPGEAWGGPTD